MHQTLIQKPKISRLRRQKAQWDLCLPFKGVEDKVAVLADPVN